jgi:hypothetical protein
MPEAHEVEVDFALYDAVERDEAAALLADLRAIGVEGEILSEHPRRGMLEVAAIVALIGVSTASAGALAVIAAFIYRVFHKGVILDLREAKPKVRKSDDLPKGTLLIMKPDGTTDLRQGVDSSTIGGLMKDAIASAQPS